MRIRIHRPVLNRVGHCVLLHSERIIILRYFKERNVLFFELFATYETQKNVAFFSRMRVLLQRTRALFKRTQKDATFYSKKEHCVLLKRARVLLKRARVLWKRMHLLF